MFDIRIFDTIKYVKNENNIIGRFFVWLIYWTYILIDFINNLCIIFPFLIYTNKRKNTKINREEFSNYTIDVYIIVLFILNLFGYFFKLNDYYIQLFLSFFIWQIVQINIFALREILNIGIAKISIVSFPRTFGALILNFIKINLAFSYLYDYFKLYPKFGKYGLLIKNMLFFTSLDVDNLIYTCPTQKWILFFQIITFFIFVIVFVANISNLKREKK